MHTSEKISAHYGGLPVLPLLALALIRAIPATRATPQRIGASGMACSCSPANINRASFSNGVAGSDPDNTLITQGSDAENYQNQADNHHGFHR